MTMRKLIVVAGLLFSIIIGAGIWHAYNQVGNGNLSLTISPSNAKVTLNDKTINTSSSLPPGTYLLTASRYDFDTKELTVTVKAGKTAPYTIALVPSNASGRQWLVDHPDQQAIADSVQSQQFDSAAEHNSKNSPIVSDLPQFVNIPNPWRIDYGSSTKYPHDATKVGLYITADSPQGRQSALTWMYAHGYNPADYEIIFQSVSKYSQQVNSIGSNQGTLDGTVD
jgi:hypothetical protein